MISDISPATLHAIIFVIVAILIAWVAVTLIRKA